VSPAADHEKSCALGLIDEHMRRLTFNYGALGRDHRFQFSGSGQSNLDRAFGLFSGPV
jgi:hypothetical protein